MGTTGGVYSGSNGRKYISAKCEWRSQWESVVPLSHFSLYQYYLPRLADLPSSPGSVFFVPTGCMNRCLMMLEVRGAGVRGGSVGGVGSTKIYTLKRLNRLNIYKNHTSFFNRGLNHLNWLLRIKYR